MRLLAVITCSYKSKGRKWYFPSEQIGRISKSHLDSCFTLIIFFFVSLTQSHSFLLSLYFPTISLSQDVRWWVSFGVMIIIILGFYCGGRDASLNTKPSCIMFCVMPRSRHVQGLDFLEMGKGYLSLFPPRLSLLLSRINILHTQPAWHSFGQHTIEFFLNDKFSFAQHSPFLISIRVITGQVHLPASHNNTLGIRLFICTKCTNTIIRREWESDMLSSHNKMEIKTWRKCCTGDMMAFDSNDSWIPVDSTTTKTSS